MCDRKIIVYGSLVFALQRANILFRPIGRNNEFPLRGFWLSHSLNADP
uniref:Uncharacterized protein n=1 Tax=Leptospira santarosai serovar Arenal str. MAVJ 401 TaxID=1049976 RepID=M6JLX4_9LEPT|nr:hypothetical protein LEP1GSC063_1763 [Leptospira santarosai serovar Arenal str. MAVJ 401]